MSKVRKEDTYTELKPYKGYGITKAVEYGEYNHALCEKIGDKKSVHYDIYELDDPDWLIDSRLSLKEAKALIDKWTN